METVKSGSRLPSVVATTAVLLAAGLTPVAAEPEISTRAVDAVSAEVALAGSAVVDTFDALAGIAAFNGPDTAEVFDIPGAAEVFDLPGAAEAFDIPGAAAAFDFVGLFNAELAAAQGFFNSLFSLPVTFFNNVQDVVNSLINLDFGMAFSAAVSIPQDIINYVLGLPGLVINTVFNMVVVLPGEYLFNFG